MADRKDIVDGEEFGHRILDFQLMGKFRAGTDDSLLVKSEFTKGNHRLLASEQIALFGQLLSRLLVALQGGGHLLVVHPLVADELQLVAGFGRLQILVGRIDETGGKLVLLLQGGISQRSVDGVLGQVGTGLAGQGGVQIGAGRGDLRVDIVHHLARGVHIFKNACVRGDVAGHLVGHVDQGSELKGAGLHHHVNRGNVVLEFFIVREELLHVGKALGRSLAGEAGRLGDVAAGVALVDRPVYKRRNDETDGASKNDRGQDDDTFFTFHDSMILIVLLNFLLQM